ncbi:hypothetical protein MFLAVUS_009286 [Mucor flavus]|uniref:Uncharacterized protein n=1 Tax=Mucor flavus TaxID=439312 RepID=A0ABP9Z9G7_9FUNG
MLKPLPKSISPTFYFPNSDIKKFSLPSLFKGFEVSKWNDCNELVEIINGKLGDEQALKKWKSAFESIEARYTRNVPVASFAGKMAEYLDDGNGADEFLTSYHRKEMKRLRQHEDQIKERIDKKLKIERYQAVDSHLEQEASTSHINKSHVAPENPIISSVEPPSNLIPIKSSIFKEGQRLHDLYVRGVKLEPKERNCMTAGLSGILDLTNDERVGQCSLFTEERWSKIKTYYFKRYKMKTSPPELWIKEKWEYICAKIVEKGNVGPGRKYLDRLCGSTKVLDSEYNMYKFLDTILDNIQNSQHVLNPMYPRNIPEGDFTYTIWKPLFKRLFEIDTRLIRLKPSETVPDDSTSEKAYIYEETNKHLIGFKVDLRFIYDFEDKEFDLCDLECSLEDADDEKTYHDHSKLIREGKTNTISLYNAIDDIPVIHTWIIQACGLKLYVSTVVYVDDNLFVVIPQFDLKYPTTIGQLNSFIDGIQHLFMLKKDVEKLAQTSSSRLHRARDDRKGKAVQRMHSRNYRLSPPRYLISVPGTVNWHTPPRNDVYISKIPKKNIDIYETASNTSLDSDEDCSNDNTIDDLINADTEEEEDFVLTKKGWFCKTTNKYFDTNPF